MIYLLHETPNENAKLLDNVTLSKQIKEIAQTLCQAHHVEIYKKHNIATYDANCCSPPGFYVNKANKIPLKFKKDEPITKILDWTMTCIANYRYLVKMGLAFCEEWRYRNNNKNTIWEINNKFEYRDGSTIQIHPLENIIFWAHDSEPDLPNSELTPFPICVPDKYRKIRQLITDDYIDDIEESYRNYYRVKVKCTDCNGHGIDDTGWDGSLGNHDPFKDCKKCEAGLKATWTNRLIPEFLK